MITYSATPPGTDAWLAERSCLLTASNAAMLRGKSETRQKYIRRVAWHAVHGADSGEDSYKSAAMERGNQLEPLAADASGLQFGLLLAEVGICTNADWQHCGASLDRLDISGSIAVECKCPLLDTMIDYDHSPEKLAAKYKWQCIMQMIIAELDIVHLYAWHPVHRPVWHTFDSNDCLDDINEMQQAMSRAIVDLEREIIYQEEMKNGK